VVQAETAATATAAARPGRPNRLHRNFRAASFAAAQVIFAIVGSRPLGKRS
jgi:hypothetical protein